ncbi:hypothetical protein [Candidatus Phycosocius spiralis]|uniref:Uncharacterized protein n=1 Tax=Candidatus Phycosocius spiralis TaxID=2815099 RepID=A0ABQ4PW46_9PROT|nr:hypothetical protein [Candidatus Phycosocius spiralis]GIU67275.1 hypothetical protein PsB1_1429 [Candidatus Phycosocius spiralis]
MSDQQVCLSNHADLKDLDPSVLAAANINPKTGLATDYLNVFNEAVMLFGLLAEMPDMLEELKNWEPLSYEEHFARSGFMAKDLAIVSYLRCDPTIKAGFDALSTDLGHMVQEAIAQAEIAITQGEDIVDFIAITSGSLRSQIMLLDRMVHGGDPGGAQDDIDALFS